MFSRRRAIRLTAAGLATTAGLGATTRQDITAAADDLGDYELTVTVSINHQDRSAVRANGRVPRTHGTFVVEASRMAGYWRTRVSPVDENAGDDDLHLAPAVFDVRGQTTGGDAMTLLQALLGGHALDTFAVD